MVRNDISHSFAVLVLSALASIIVEFMKPSFSLIFDKLYFFSKYVLEQTNITLTQNFLTIIIIASIIGNNLGSCFQIELSRQVTFINVLVSKH